MSISIAIDGQASFLNDRRGADIGFEEARWLSFIDFSSCTFHPISPTQYPQRTELSIIVVLGGIRCDDGVLLSRQDIQFLWGQLVNSIFATVEMLIRSGEGRDLCL